MQEFDAWESPFDSVRPQNAMPDSSITYGQGWDAFVSMKVNGLQLPTEQTAMTITAVFACISLIAGAIAALPMQIFKRTIATGEADQVHDDPLWWVLNEEMSPRWMAAAAWEFMVACLLLLGDAFAVIRRNRGGDVLRIVPVHPDRVTVLVDWTLERLVYVVEPEAGSGMRREVLDQDDVLHVAGLGFDGTRGKSVLRNALRVAGSVALATQDYSAKFFGNSARPDYVLYTEQKLEPERVTSMYKKIDERYAGEGPHRPMILQGGLKPETLSLPLEEIQLLSTRQFQIEEICRIYGVPPFMVGHNEKTTSWGTGVESMGIGFVRYTLRPWLNKFENEFNRKLFRTASRSAAFDTADLERADLKAMFDAYRVALGRAGEQPFMDYNEIRAKLHLKRRDDLKPNPGAANAPQPAEPTPAK